MASLRLHRVILLLLLIASLLSGQEAPVRRERSAKESQSRWLRRVPVTPGQPSALLRQQAYEQKMRMRTLRARISSTSSLISSPLIPAAWKSLGPAPLASDASGIGQQDYNWVSGRATSVAIDRADTSGNTVYVGGAYGGVWKSTNAASPDPAAVNWVPLTDNEATLAVGAIAIQPQLTNPDPAHSVVLVGTGETDSSTDSYYGLGILRSIDAGLHWSLISQDASGTRPFAGIGFSKIAFSSVNPNVAVATAAGASQGLINGLANPPTANLGLYYSTNSGAAWTFATIRDGSSTIAPGSATSVVYNAAAGLFFSAIRSHGFYSSSDGIIWNRLANQPGAGLTTASCPPNPSSSGCPIYRGEISVVSNRNEMYVWYVDANDNDQGIWKSVDAGAHWTQISTTSIAACGDSLGGCGTENSSYNLSLFAIADGATPTNLYAGAVNLYKCRINSQSLTCAGPNTFLNLTHVYGCAPNFGSIARVHPAQHAIDGLVVGGSSLLYFANDGGIYRALDGYTGLTSGDCSANNQFDSLNQTLGSMTQFISFAQHPSDANTLLGGTQGNGSPATSEALVTGTWRNVNSGDGGYSAINPANPLEWFTSAPGVNIQRCAFGVACHSQDFAADAVVLSTTLENDTGPFYTPFILDPQSPGAMIVGTCRAWRGMSNGVGFVPLSNNFDTGSAAICSGNESNLVGALAAGGPKDGNGLSQVIYAGTDGFGPLVPTSPPAGRLWVTSDANGGPNTWADRTGTINPKHFPISSIAMDTSDANGTTAFVGIMGFQGPRVWMTPSAGISWVDFTGNLPDSPVNTLLVDPGPDPLSGTVYAGTDVGVFASSTSSPNWTEVMPSTGTGFLPNVPVTGLRIFNNGITKLLRASTYGRGLWQFPLTAAADFQVSVANPNQTTFPSQTATFAGALNGFNEYISVVTLSCVPGATPSPATCSASPLEVIPSASGATFAIATSGAVGDYAFKLRASGSDPAQLTHEIALALHIVDFGLTVPSPTGVTLNPGKTSDPVLFQATAQGAFNGDVLLSCSGLPAGANCNFSPSNVARPTAGNPANVSLAIATASSTLPDVYTITIHAATAGSPDKTQNLTLAIGKVDFSISVSDTPLTATVNTSAVFHGTVSTNSGYSNTVNLACGSGAPAVCNLSPSALIPSTGGTPFTVTVRSGAAQNYNFNIVAQGTDKPTTEHSVPVTLQSVFDFSLSVDPGLRTVTAGQPAIYTLLLTPDGGSFVSTVNLSCSDLPAKTSCDFTPAQVSAGSRQTTVGLTIQTTPPTFARRWRSITALALCLPGLTLAFSRRRKHRLPAFALTAALMAVSFIACGGGLEGNATGGGIGPKPGTTPGNHLITITATGPVSHSVQVTLTVQQ